MESIEILLIILSIIIFLSIVLYVLYYFGDKIGRLFEGVKDLVKKISKKPSKYFYLLIFYIFIFLVLISIFIMIINENKLEKTFGTATLYIITIIIFFLIMLFIWLFVKKFNEFFETSFTNNNNYSKGNFIL
jgi:amino acid transporter